MKTNKSNKDLTYEVICAAVNGDYDAEEIILDYFEPYIIKLSKIPFIDKHNKVSYMIDEDIYMSLRLKLHSIILNFQVA